MLARAVKSNIVIGSKLSHHIIGVKHGIFGNSAQASWTVSTNVGISPYQDPKITVKSFDATYGLRIIIIKEERAIVSFSHGRSRKERDKPCLYTDWASARSASSMRCAHRFVQIQMHHIK